jgi:hypothetical protein
MYPTKNDWVLEFVHYSGILKTGKHNVSETEGDEAPTLLGPLKSDKLSN